MEEDSNSTIIASFPKNAREAVCVGISEYKGKKLVFVRSYVPSLAGTLTPTRDGISLSIDKYEELAQAIKSLENVMSNEKLVAKIKKNSKEEIRIALNVYKGVPLIQIRTYAAYGRDTELIATKKGLAINVNLLPLLIESIEKLSSTVNLLK